MKHPLLNTALLLLPLAFPLAAGAGPLADQMAGDDVAQREEALKALLAQGPGALGELREILAHRSPAGKMAAIRIIAGLDGAEATEALAQALSQESPVAFAAAAALAYQGDARGESFLRDALASPEVLVRVQAANALSALGSAGAIPELLRALQDESEPVCVAAHEALCDITLQDFDYRPEAVSRDLPLDETDSQESAAIQQWRIEQFELLKSGNYTYKDATGKEHKVDKRQPREGENRIRREAADRWAVLRTRCEEKQAKARQDALSAWRGWWDAHKAEGASDWLRAGMRHPKASVRRRAAVRVATGEMRDFVPSLIEALGVETDFAVAEAQARALASFKDRSVVEPLIACMERMQPGAAEDDRARDAKNSLVSGVDLALMDLTAVRGIPPSGAGWRGWWNRVSGFYEIRALQMYAGQEYALVLKGGSEEGVSVEVRRWMPRRNAPSGSTDGEWLIQAFEVKPGDVLGRREVDAKDAHGRPYKVDLMPGLTLESLSRGTREISRRPLKREPVIKAVLKGEVADPAHPEDAVLTLEVPVR